MFVNFLLILLHSSSIRIKFERSTLDKSIGKLKHEYSRTSAGMVQQRQKDENQQESVLRRSEAEVDNRARSRHVNKREN